MGEVRRPNSGDDTLHTSIVGQSAVLNLRHHSPTQRMPTGTFTGVESIRYVAGPLGRCVVC